MTDTGNWPASHPHGGPGPRALSFGAVAEEYDRYRPRYPADLVADVCALLPGRRVVEIGAGTGIATDAFAAYDLDITCVEPDPEMAGVLRRKFAGNDRVAVTVATLEAWSASRSPAGPTYDGLISGQAWHWTAPETRWRDAAAALSSGGLLALFWNGDGYADPAVPALMGEVYRSHGIEDRAAAAPGADRADLPTGRARFAEWPANEIEASTDFTDLEVRTYRWSRQQTVADHVARLNTVSAHLILPAAVRAALSADLGEALSRHAGTDLELAMRTDLFQARRR